VPIFQLEGGFAMRILTNISKAELNYLTSQPTAKAMHEKVMTEGIYIPPGDAQGAAEFVAGQKQQKRDSLQISPGGIAAVQKDKDEKKEKSLEEQLKDRIAELKEELAELLSQPANSEEAKEIQEKQANIIRQEILLLNMQLIELQKNNK